MGKLINLKRVSNYEVEKWLEKKIRDLTPYQKEWIKNEEIIRFAPFEFYEKKKVVGSIWLRLSIILLFPVTVILILGLPFNFIFTGSWGYDHKNLNWYSTWASACGF